MITWQLGDETLRRFAPIHEPEQNQRNPTSLCSSSMHRGVGIGAEHAKPETKLEQLQLSPLASNVLTAVSAAGPAGITPDDLRRATERSHPKAGAALIEATINELLLSGKIGRINGKLVASGEGRS